jgi:hypothetical protein
MHLVSNACLTSGDPDREYEAAVANIDWLIKTLNQPAELKTVPAGKPEVLRVPAGNTTREEFEAMVVKAKEAIAAGDIYQVVLSQRFETEFKGDELDLSQLAREQILLNLPEQVLCREDCKGICPTCGKDLNEGDCKCGEDEIDPRWAALKDLRN